MLDALVPRVRQMARGALAGVLGLLIVGPAVAWTMMPANAGGFLKQRLRWARNSYRCYLRAFFRGWLFRQPVRALARPCPPQR